MVVSPPKIMVLVAPPYLEVGLNRFDCGLTLRVQQWALVLHRNSFVGLAGNNLELSGNVKPEMQATAIRSRFSG